MSRIWEDSADRIWGDSVDRIWEDDTPTLQAESGSYLITGSEVNLFSSLSIEVKAGAYQITGSDVTLSIPPKLEAEAGVYQIAGSPALLILPVSIQVEAGVYRITGSPALLKTTTFVVEAGAYAIEAPGADFGIGISPEINAKSIYLFTLTGDQDATTDIEIPIRSIQARLRSATPTYLQVVIPGLTRAAAINARSNGLMKVDFAYLRDGEIFQRDTIIEANLEDIRLDEGPFNKSITLTGHKQKTYQNKNITLDGPIYAGTINGATRYRFAIPNVYLNPGDTVTVGSDTFNANVISYFIGARPGGMTTQMEMSEDG